MRLLFALLLLAPLVNLAGPKPATYYYCASGNRVKYHTSPTCQGLRWCRATVKPLSLAHIRRERMEPCYWCH